MTCVPNNANKRESYLLYEKSGKHLFRRLSSKHKQSYYFKILHQTSGEFLFWLSKKHRLRIICRVGHCSDDWRQTCGRELVWHTHTHTQSHLSTHLDFVKTPLLSCVDKTVTVLERNGQKSGKHLWTHSKVKTPWRVRYFDNSVLFLDRVSSCLDSHSTLLF